MFDFEFHFREEGINSLRECSPWPQETFPLEEKTQAKVKPIERMCSKYYKSDKTGIIRVQKT